MQKTMILTAMILLLVGDAVYRKSVGDTWADILINGAVNQWLAVVIILATLLTMVDLGAGDVAVVLAVLVAVGYLASAAGYLGTSFQAFVKQTWGTA